MTSLGHNYYNIFLPDFDSVHMCFWHKPFWCCRRVFWVNTGAVDWYFGSIPCLLMPWLLKSPDHQQALYWLSRTDNTYCCSRVNFLHLGKTNSKIRFKMWIYLFVIFIAIQHVNSASVCDHSTHNTACITALLFTEYHTFVSGIKNKIHYIQL